MIGVRAITIGVRAITIGVPARAIPLPCRIGVSKRNGCSYTIHPLSAILAQWLVIGRARRVHYEAAHINQPMELV